MNIYFYYRRGFTKAGRNNLFFNYYLTLCPILFGDLRTANVTVHTDFRAFTSHCVNVKFRI